MPAAADSEANLGIACLPFKVTLQVTVTDAFVGSTFELEIYSLKFELELWTFESGVSRFHGHPRGPEGLSAGCSTAEPEVIAEVPLATSM